MDLDDEVIIIECDISDSQQKSELTKETRSYKSKMPKPMLMPSVYNKRRVVLKELGQHKETLVITQQLNVNKNNLQCVVNINGKMNDDNRIVDLTELSEKASPSQGVKSKSVKSKKRGNPKKPNRSVDKSNVKNNISIEKILPKCNRINCQHYLRNWRAENDKLNNIARKAKFSRYRKYKPEPNLHSAKLTGVSKVNKRKSNMLSLVSSSPLCEEFNNDDDKLAYEDISSEDDFSFLLNGKLDTLIKRTKERDRKIMNTEVNLDKHHNDMDTKTNAVKIVNNNYIQALDGSVLTVEPKCSIKMVPLPNEIPVIPVSNQKLKTLKTHK